MFRCFKSFIKDCFGNLCSNSSRDSCRKFFRGCSGHWSWNSSSDTFRNSQIANSLLQKCFLKFLLELLERFLTAISPEILSGIFFSEMPLENTQGILLELPPGGFAEVSQTFHQRLHRKLLLGLIENFLHGLFENFFHIPTRNSFRNNFRICLLAFLQEYFRKFFLELLGVHFPHFQTFRRKNQFLWNSFRFVSNFCKFSP